MNRAMKHDGGSEGLAGDSFEIEAKSIDERSEAMLNESTGERVHRKSWFVVPTSLVLLSGSGFIIYDPEAFFGVF